MKPYQTYENIQTFSPPKPKKLATAVVGSWTFLFFGISYFILERIELTF